MGVEDPKSIKEYGRQVKNFDETVWKEHAYKIVEQGNYLKFTQDEELKRVLLSTGDMLLVEASPSDK